MATDLLLEPFAWETATTTGTGNFTLAGAATGYQTLNSAVGTSNNFPYFIVSQSGSEYEFGITHLSAATTLVRDADTQVLYSSNSNNRVNFSAGTKDVFLGDPQLGFGPQKTVQVNTTLGVEDEVLFVDCNAADRTITLPPVANYPGKEFHVQKVDSGSDTVTVAEDAGDTSTVHDRINGAAASQKLYVQGDYARWKSDGVAWWMVEDGLIPHHGHIERSTVQNILDSTDTHIQMNSSVFEIGVSNDITTNYRIDLNRKGKYHAICAATIKNMDSGDSMIVRLQKNGATMRESRGDSISVFSNQEHVEQCAAIENCNASDSWRVRMTHYEGSAQDTATTANRRPFIALHEIR